MAASTLAAVAPPAAERRAGPSAAGRSGALRGRNVPDDVDTAGDRPRRPRPGRAAATGRVGVDVVRRRLAGAVRRRAARRGAVGRPPSRVSAA